MECNDIMKRLDAWIDGELSVREAEKIIRHLKGCSACRLEAKRLQRLSEALDNLPSLTAPGGLYRRTMAAFKTAAGKPGLRQWWHELSMVMRSAVCGAALAGLLCGAVLGSSLTTLVADPSTTNPYLALFTSRGIIP